MPTPFADSTYITAQINHIVNRSGTEFSEFGDTGESADKRYNDDVINEARRKAAYRIFEAIGRNPAHPYWATLAEDVELASGSIIPPYFGEIGTPKIQAVADDDFRTGRGVGADEIESYISDPAGTFSDVFGTGPRPHDQLTNNTLSPLALKYSTDNGVFKYTGVSAKIPMIKAPDIDAMEDMADDKIPYALASLNVKLAIPLILKEGDNLYRLGVYLGEQGERELMQVAAGSITTKPIDIQKAIQVSQKIT